MDAMDANEHTSLLHHQRNSVLGRHARVASDADSESSHARGIDAPGEAVTVADVSSTKVPVSKYLVDISDLRFWTIFLCIFLNWFVACFDTTLMASSHPVISTYFHASKEASWLSTSFMLTSSAFSPMFARISDTFGRKRPLLFGMATFGLGTAWCALAPTLGQFVAARAVCGLGAGATVSQGLILMSDLLPLARRGVYVSLLNLAYCVGSCLGAALGGYLAEHVGWRWEFAIQLPVIAAVFVLVALTLPTDLGPQLAKRQPQPWLVTMRSFDVAGSVLLALTVGVLILLLNLGGVFVPWSHPVIFALVGLFILSGALLLAAEKRTPYPVLPLHLLFQVPRGPLVLSNFFVGMSLNTVLFNIPLYFQATLLDSPTTAGLRLLVPFMANMAAAFLTGNLITYTGRTRVFLVSGNALMVLGVMLLACMGRDIAPWICIVFATLPMVAQGFTYPSVTIAQLSVTRREDLAVASATLMLFRNLSTILGVAVSSLTTQNALGYYLPRTVTGDDKDQVIEQVLNAVESIRDLSPQHKKQVIDAYSSTMHWTFGQAVFTAVAALGLVMFLKLPRLHRK